MLKSPPIDTKTTLVLIALIIVIVIFILYIYLYQYLKKRFHFQSLKDLNINRNTFKTLGVSVGLTPEEIKILLNTVVSSNIKSPYTCFTNIRVLDDLLKKGFTKLQNDNNLEDTDKERKVAMLFEIKAKIEANSKSNAGIRSTHLIETGQKIVVFLKGKGYYYAQIIKNTHQSLQIELLSDKIQQRILSSGDFIKVYFWWEQDAGYIFESSITARLEHVKEYSIQHSDHLLRTQKRKYRRIPVTIRGNYYPIHIVTNKGRRIFSIKQEEMHPCSVTNLSAGGIRVELIDEHFEERYKKEKLLKIEFMVNNHECSVVGKIIRQHHFKNGRYDLTIQFARINIKDKNVINQKVYDYLPDY